MSYRAFTTTVAMAVQQHINMSIFLPACAMQR